MPKVSVVIPTYNRAYLISQTIDSLLTQTYQDFEVIVVDDGSTDNSRDVLLHYGERVVYIYQNNAGPSKARNKGILAAKGEFLTFLDSDDIFLPTKLEAQVAYLERHPEVGVVYSGWQVLSEDGTTVLTETNPTQEGDVLKDLLVNGYLFPPIAALMRRECIDRVGLFDESLPAFEDPDFWLRVARAGYKFGCIKQPLCQYRMTSNSLGKDLPTLEHAVPLVLQKFFDDPDLPPEIMALKDEIYARRYLSFALNHYYTSTASTTTEEAKIARKYLAQALALKPDILMGQHEFLDLIPHKALELNPPNPAAHVYEVMSTLFSGVDKRQWLQSRLLGKLHVILAFRAYEAGYQSLVIGHVLRGWRYDPSWLKNRGLSSLLVKSLLGRML